MMPNIDSYTIEPEFARDGSSDGFWVWGHGEYEFWSVLSGQYARVRIAHFDTVAEAKSAYPQAEVLDHNTTPFRSGGESLGELSGLPDCPPDWFDPANAGECWHEDDY